MIESLENRRLLAGVTAVLSNGILTISGTSRGDNIAIAAGRRTITLEANGVSTPFNARFIRAMRIFSGRGDDTVIVSPNLTLRASIETGDGNDRVGGGALNDTIFAQGGNDTVVGNNGDDYLDGGAGDDYLEDTKGVNAVHGGGGTDRSLQDGYQLGSGVENRTTQLNPNSGRTVNGSTDLVRENNRLFLVYSGSTPSNNDLYVQTGPTLTASGNYEVVSNVSFSTTATAADTFEQRWDITNQAADGIIFTRNDGVAGQTLTTAFSIPFLIPTR